MVTKHTTFGRGQAETVRRELQVILDRFSEDSGLKVTIGRSTFDSNGVTMKVEAKLMAIVRPEVAGGVSVRAIPSIAVSMAVAQNLDHDKWGCFAGKRFRMCDFNPRAHKTPWIGEDANGKRYRFQTAQARTMWSKPTKEVPASDPMFGAAAAPTPNVGVYQGDF